MLGKLGAAFLLLAQAAVVAQSGRAVLPSPDGRNALRIELEESGDRGRRLAIEARAYADAADAERPPKNLVIEKRQVDRYARLRVALAPAGGYAVRFVAVN